MRTKHFVRQSLFFGAVLCSTFLGGTLLPHAERLPDIDAREFAVTPLETSTSGRVYRFRIEGGSPRTGELLLVRKEDKPVAAFRVLKTGGTEFIAKRVRKYESQLNLELNQPYIAVEKIADLVEPVLEPATPSTAPMAAETPGVGPPAEENGAAPSGPSAPAAPVSDPNAVPLMGDEGTDLTPVPAGGGSGLDQYDEGLDSTTTPQDPRSIQDGGQEARIGPGVEEREPLSKFKNMIGMSVGSFRNMSGFSIPGTTNNGFTVYYNWITEESVWFEGHAPHDTLSIEAGLGHYSRANFTGVFDNYDVMPIRGEFLYTLHLSPSFAVLSHIGAQFNLVYAAENAVEEGMGALSGIQANLGAGFLYQIGPQWYVRGDVGLDRLAVGLAVKW